MNSFVHIYSFYTDKKRQRSVGTRVYTSRMFEVSGLSYVKSLVTTSEVSEEN